MAMERANDMEHCVSIKLYVESKFIPLSTIPNSPADILEELLEDYGDDSKYQWAYILHDEDVLDATGQLCKPHYHIALRKISGTFSVSQLAKKYHISRNDIRRCDHFDGYLVYLLHADKESMANNFKHLYPDNRLICNFEYESNLQKAYKGLTSDNEFQIVMDIIDYICNTKCNYYQALDHFKRLGVSWSIIRKNFAIINAVVTDCKSRNYRLG